MLLQTTFSDNEVNQSTLGSDFRAEMGIEHLSDQVETEIDVIVNGVTAHLKNVVLAFLLNGTGKKWVQSGINFLLDTFNEDKFAHLDGVDQVVEPAVLVRVDHDEVLTHGATDPNLSL